MAVKTRYEVEAYVPGIGVIKHVVKSGDRDEAKQKFKRAYAKKGRVDDMIVRELRGRK